MTLKEYRDEARTYHYDFPTVTVGLATEVMKKIGPKLSICTYHLPDDREVPAEIIMKANPRYRIVQGPAKLYAQVV